MPIPLPRKNKTPLIEVLGRVVFVLTIVVVSGFVTLFFGTRMVLYQIARSTDETFLPMNGEAVPEHAPFPLGVDPALGLITEHAGIEEYFSEDAKVNPLTASLLSGWLGNTFLFLTQQSWYQNLASPTGRVLVILPGERKEEIASHFAKILGWDAEMKASFLESVISKEPELIEGKFIPGSYITEREATPEDVARLVNDHFENEVVARYSNDVESVVPLKDALTIASLLEREAYDFEDMRYISGVIWNRLFLGMNLQIDATLQYAKGTKSRTAWWPRVVPADKYIDSPYNTYDNEGLPPAPISNVSLEAILAALNPRKTDCIFYFHDKASGFHCTATYEEHVKLLKQYYGRGK